MQALRHHTRDDVEQLLIRTMVTDDHPDVRKHAHAVFARHERRRDIREIHALMSDYASNPNNWTTVERARRGLGELNDLLAFSFRFELPGLDFVLGNPDSDTGSGEE